MAQMAEEHGHELRPTGETLGAFLGPVLPHQLIEFIPGYLLQQLTEQTRLPYHDAEALLLYGCVALPCFRSATCNTSRRASTAFLRPCFGQE